MGNRVTLQDVARQAGVSTATVSRVLNGKGVVSDDTRDRVHAAAAAVRFQGASRKRSAAPRQTRTIAVVLNHLDWPIIPDWLLALHRTITGFGYNTIVAASEGGSSIRQHCERLILDRAADGVIFYSPQGETYAAIVERLGIADPFRHGRGLFCIDIDGRRGFHVLIDEEQVGRLAASHLISASAKQIAMIGGPVDVAGARARQEAFLDSLEALGQPRESILVEPASDWNYHGGYAAMDALMARSERLDGLFVSSDNAAMGALRLLHERGVQPPDDLVMVSVDNIAGSAFTAPSLTTIDIRIRERARTAVAELVHLLEDPGTEPRDVTVPVNLVVRESSRPRSPRGAGELASSGRSTPRSGALPAE